MKYRLLPLILFLALVSCTRSERLDPLGGKLVKIDPTQPPSGMHLVQILLENQSIPLKGTHCEASGLSPDNRRLQHQLALTLGEGFGNPRHRRELSGGCEPDQYEFPSGESIDAWQCNLGAVTKNKKGEFIASSHIYFGIKKDTWELIRTPRALRCL